MAHPSAPESRWRRWLLGGRDSWRRIALTGIGAGVTVAFVAALVTTFVGSGGGGPLDEQQPTAIVPGVPPLDGGPVDIAPPTEEPLLPTPTPEIVPPTEPPPSASPVPTEPAPTEPPPTEPIPTELPATPTAAPEEPTPAPTATVVPDESGP